jgi:hypothetical protein
MGLLLALAVSALYVSMLFSRHADTLHGHGHTRTFDDQPDSVGGLTDRQVHSLFPGQTEGQLVKWTRQTDRRASCQTIRQDNVIWRSRAPSAAPFGVAAASRPPKETSTTEQSWHFRDQD